jgi:hypothetical protein
MNIGCKSFHGIATADKARERVVEAARHSQISLSLLLMNWACREMALSTIWSDWQIRAF